MTWDAEKDRLNPERTGKQLARMAELVPEVGKFWLEGLEAGVYQGQRDSPWRPPRSESDPTSGAVMSPAQRAVRGKVKRASVMIEQALQHLEDARSALVDGLLLTDDEFRAWFYEKRNAAEQG